MSVNHIIDIRRTEGKEVHGTEIRGGGGGLFVEKLPPG